MCISRQLKPNLHNNPQVFNSLLKVRETNQYYNYPSFSFLRFLIVPITHDVIKYVHGADNIQTKFCVAFSKTSNVYGPINNEVDLWNPIH